MSGRAERALVVSRLPYWVEYLTHGYWPGHGEVVVRGSAPTSRPPAPVWVYDLSIAFGNLNPLTANQRYGDHAWVAHAPFNQAQEVLWLYYGTIPGTDTPLDLRAARKSFWQHERERAEAEALTRWQRRRDADVARALHLSTWKAGQVRREALYTLVAELGSAW